MTRDNRGGGDDMGNPDPVAMEPADVIKCRECGGLVRRVNQQHLRTVRCRFGSREAERSGIPRPDHPETIREYKDKYPDAPVMAPREKAELSAANSDPKVDRRRREMVRMRWDGDSMTNVVERVANRYGVAESTVWTDWKNRADWMPRVFGYDEVEGKVTEALAQKENVRERLQRIATRAENQNELRAAVQAWKAYDGSLDKSVDVMSDMMEAAPSPGRGGSVSVTKSETVEYRPEPGEDLDEDVLRMLDSVTGGDGDEEIIDAEFSEVEEEGDE